MTMNERTEKNMASGKQGGQELGKWKKSILKILTNESDTEETEEISLQNFIRTLDGEWLMRQIPLLFVIAVFFVVMTTCRYQWQQQVIEKGDLQKKTEDVTIRSLVLKSELTEKMRQSNIEERLRNNGDSTLLPSTDAPFIIHVSRQKQ